MIKVSWGKDAGGLPSHLAYITGTGRYRHKRFKERISCSQDIATPRTQAGFLAEYADALAPDHSKGQRRSKRTDLRLVISWLGDKREEQEAFLDDFMGEHFQGCLWTWARHVKPNRLGQQTSHFHVVVCPRRLDGPMLDVKRDDLRRFQNAYLKISKQHGLATGWDRKPQKEVKERPPRKRRRRVRTRPATRGLG